MCVRVIGSIPLNLLVVKMTIHVEDVNDDQCSIFRFLLNFISSIFAGSSQCCVVPDTFSLFASHICVWVDGCVDAENEK